MLAANECGLVESVVVVAMTTRIKKGVDAGDPGGIDADVMF